MTEEQRRKNLAVPAGKADVVIDTDAFNEIDDQFALAYLLRSAEKLNTVAVYAAPFFNEKSTGPADGMEKSYNEIYKVLGLMNETREVFRGSLSYLPSEKTPVVSDAAKDLAERANRYSPEHPLYVVAIGAITNVASALLLNAKVAENTVVVWLGGHAWHHHDTKEFNMRQDYAAARVVMDSGVPFVQLPCMGVVSAFTVSGPELEKWFVGRSPIADYLAKNAITAAESYAKGRAWTRVIWDVTAVGWLLNDGQRFMRARTVTAKLPDDDGRYSVIGNYPISYVYSINRDELFRDLIEKVTRL